VISPNVNSDDLPRIVQDLIATIVSDIGALYKASEAIAILDMLWSFAHVSISECRSGSPRNFNIGHTPVRNYGDFPSFQYLFGPNE
jgi:hypothetical protein